MARRRIATAAPVVRAEWRRVCPEPVALIMLPRADRQPGVTLMHRDAAGDLYGIADVSADNLLTFSECITAWMAQALAHGCVVEDRAGAANMLRMASDTVRVAEAMALGWVPRPIGGWRHPDHGVVADVDAALALSRRN